MKKRVTCVLLVVLLLMVQVPSVFAVTDSGKCGNNLTWTLDDSGTLTISGTGEMDDYDSFEDYYSPWHKYEESIMSISIMPGVTSIGTEAFSGKGYAQVTQLIIPDSVIKIGSNAFSGCDNLKKVIIPESVVSIGMSYTSRGIGINCVFSPLVKFTNAGPIGSGCDMEFGWTNAIPDAAFFGDTFSEITIPKGIISIGKSAFYECNNLTKVVLPYGVTVIKNDAFVYCHKLTEIVIPSTVTDIGRFAFDGCSQISDIYIWWQSKSMERYRYWR